MPNAENAKPNPSPGNELTFGEKIVRVKFNPSESSDVDTIKQEFASLINKIKEKEYLDPRLCAMAISNLEVACMEAVKMLTAGA